MLPRAKTYDRTPSDKFNGFQILVFTTTNVIEGKSPHTRERIKENSTYTSF